MPPGSLCLSMCACVCVYKGNVTYPSGGWLMKRTIVLLWMAPSASFGSGPVSQRLLHTPALNSFISMHLSIRLAICFLPQYLCSSLSLFSFNSAPSCSFRIYSISRLCVLISNGNWCRVSVLMDILCQGTENTTAKGCRTFYTFMGVSSTFTKHSKHFSWCHLFISFVLFKIKKLQLNCLFI